MLVLPAHKRIEFQLASADVVHAFWVIDFLFKRDVLPDPEANHTDNKFQVTEIEKTGAFVGRCAELCGTYHSMMNFEVRVVEPNDFKAYLDARIAGKTNAEALQIIGLPATAVTTNPFDTRRGEQSLSAQKIRTRHAYRSPAVRDPDGVLRARDCGLRVFDRLLLPRRVEWAGVTALVMTTGLTLIIGTFFRFVARRLDTRRRTTRTPRSPTARASWASMRRTAGGRSWSRWPASVTAVGIALWLPWLIVIGGCWC